ncbi:MAG: hypothetical protein RLZZ306_1976 [Bacteroidota bacterium]|jgi:hypothetical protein
MEEHQKELIELKLLLEKMLLELNDKIVAYLPEDSDEDFEFLVRKAINYRGLIQRINNELERL